MLVSKEMSKRPIHAGPQTGCSTRGVDLMYFYLTWKGELRLLIVVVGLVVAGAALVARVVIIAVLVVTGAAIVGLRPVVAGAAVVAVGGLGVGGVVAILVVA